MLQLLAIGNLEVTNLVWIRLAVVQGLDIFL